MGSGTFRTAAGGFAERRFRARRRAWLRRIWWAVPLVASMVIGVTAGVGYLVSPDQFSIWLAFGSGTAAGLLFALLDAPPHHIERWRQGADGEKATAKALKPLSRDGWRVVHDIDTGRGNLDHVLVGPAGVFLLDTKNLHGILSVKRGVLSVRWREDPDDGYENYRLAATMRGRARVLAEQLAVDDVQPLVVLWGAFAQRSCLSGEVAWVHGKALRDVLRNRPAVFSGETVAAVAARLEATV
jgi:Nuclease-related domain